MPAKKMRRLHIAPRLEDLPDLSVSLIQGDGNMLIVKEVFIEFQRKGG
ncbi:unnamed protein product [Linum tenue]|uniref:Uncharacterized protein n=1 Tax=Linum tenue TaxID=586396 RepID=A0AAV0KKA0_9ROSI|nr:unnamed protein product [Linum tenue]CAI0422757.1 unnamed protein product [Linum tenue]